jgi:hypothetical protein
MDGMMNDRIPARYIVRVMPTNPDPAKWTDEEGQRVAQVLSTEYATLTELLSTTWSASLTRTSIFLITLSSAGIALGFAAQGGIEDGPFWAIALVVLPIVLFLGLTTFVRLVQLQRESYVYLAGMNRIRRFLQDSAPASAPYFVLPRNDDALAAFRGAGTGMRTRPPRFQLLNLIAQTQGVVGAITAAVAAAFAGMAAAPLGVLAAVGFVAPLAFVLVFALLMAYWQRSLAEIMRSTPSMYPTPAEGADQV